MESVFTDCWQLLIDLYNALMDFGFVIKEFLGTRIVINGVVYLNMIEVLFGAGFITWILLKLTPFE